MDGSWQDGAQFGLVAREAAASFLTFIFTPASAFRHRARRRAGLLRGLLDREALALEPLSRVADGVEFADVPEPARCVAPAEISLA